MAGRNTKLTPELTRKICDAIRAGNYSKIACQMVGISEAIYYRWLQKGREDDAEPLFVEFVESIEQAEAEAEVHAVALIKKAATDGSLQASTWFLERKHPDRWGRKDSIKQQIELTTYDGDTIDTEVRRLVELLDSGKASALEPPVSQTQPNSVRE